MGLFSDIGGAVLNFIGGERANRATAKLAHRQMDFQQYMSNTAHQREMKDLIAAGLNPILTATGGPGASTPSGASANMENTIGPAVNTALQSKRLRAEINNIDAQTRLANQQTATTYIAGTKGVTENQILENALKGAQVEGALDEKPIGELFEGGWRNTSVGEVTRLLNRLFGGGSSAGQIMRMLGR